MVSLVRQGPLQKSFQNKPNFRVCSAHASLSTGLEFFLLNRSSVLEHCQSSKSAAFVSGLKHI